LDATYNKNGEEMDNNKKLSRDELTQMYKIYREMVSNQQFRYFALQEDLARYDEGQAIFHAKEIEKKNGKL
jgi:hypothetical protein